MIEMKVGHFHFFGNLTGNIFRGTPGNDGLVTVAGNGRQGNVIFYFISLVAPPLVGEGPIFGRFVDETMSFVFVGVGNVLPARDAGNGAWVKATGGEGIAGKHFRFGWWANRRKWNWIQGWKVGRAVIVFR